MEPGAAVETAVHLVQAVSADRDATRATKALLASLDSQAGFDPARWQAEREALLVSPARREALETHLASIRREQEE